MTRKSKIARLPRSIRDELNRRLDNGQPGIRLVEWLNSLPEVKEVLAREFQGRRITPQNISEWKRGGYQDWLAQQEHAATLHDFLADAKELGEAASPEKITEAISNFALVHYAAAMQRCAYRPEHRDDLNRYSQMLNDAIRLRNCDLARQRFELDTQKLAFNAEKLETQTELARLRLELDRERLELARQKTRPAMGTAVLAATRPTQQATGSVEHCATMSSEGVPALSPGLRRATGRYPGEPSPSAHPRNTEHETWNTAPPAASSCPINPPGAPKYPLEINILQPNPAKSNNIFFIFSQTTTAGQPCGQSPLSFGIMQHAERNTQVGPLTLTASPSTHDPRSLLPTGVFHPLSPAGHT